MFPRIDLKKFNSNDDNKKQSKQKEKKTGNTSEESTIDINQFGQVKLRVAEVIKAEKVENTDKLLKVQLRVGTEEKQVVAGIAKHYSTDELIGKKAIFVANLKPVKLRGILSEGMILAASDNDGNLVLSSVDKNIASGSPVK